MNGIELKRPAMEYAAAISEFKQELLSAGSDFAGCSALPGCATAEEWIQLALQNEEICPEGSVTSTSYIAVRRGDNRVVGLTDFRHHINHPVLGVWGGHIGYTVRPTERAKGYAKEMLRLNLQNCREKGLDKALLVCRSDNAASERVITANGGVFDKEILVEGRKMKRFWIEL